VKQDFLDISRGDAIALTRALVRIDSRNPTLSPGSKGEVDAAQKLGAVLEAWGFSVELSDSVPGRPNLVARTGPRDAPAMMFAGHLDTVGVEGMTHDPFAADIRDERIYGRGACDMKSGVAAMCAAAMRASDSVSSPRGQIIIAAVTDEEYESLGMRALMQSGLRAECAVLTEPTRLAICPAHRGFVWTEIEFTGRAAHGSRHDLGIDAIRHAGLVLAELDALDKGTLRERSHRLLGRGSLHASTIEGGIGMSTYPDRCVLRIERRTIPGETEADSLEELRKACDNARARNPELDATIKLIAAQLPSDVEENAPVVRALATALDEEAMPVSIEGMSAWTDAAVLNENGISAVCFGPGDIGLAHAAEEFVPISDIEKATDVLARVAWNWMSEKH
jgi:acetylornithine deacetylase